ncbi:MAG: hypothetical protein KF824_02535 [Fimbriimonadaceae bacterium]|nr:MAG: hypothetical protein KF824_02535 [Fimbriimonadaceae bacterium]
MIISTILALTLQSSSLQQYAPPPTKNVQISNFVSKKRYQETLVWCWAAGMEMVLATMNIKSIEFGDDEKLPVSQANIVKIVYGDSLVTTIKSFQEFEPLTECVFVNNKNKRFTMSLDVTPVVKSDPMDMASDFDSIVESIKERKTPVLLSLWNDQSFTTAHIYAISGMSYQEDSNGYKYPSSLRIFDPIRGSGQLQPTPQGWALTFSNQRVPAGTGLEYAFFEFEEE